MGEDSLPTATHDILQTGVGNGPPTASALLPAKVLVLSNGTVYGLAIK